MVEAYWVCIFQVGDPCKDHIRNVDICLPSSATYQSVFVIVWAKVSLVQQTFHSTTFLLARKSGAKKDLPEPRQKKSSDLPFRV